MTAPHAEGGADPDPNTTPDIKAPINTPSKKGKKQKGSKKSAALSTGPETLKETKIKEAVVHSALDYVVRREKSVPLNLLVVQQIPIYQVTYKNELSVTKKHSINQARFNCPFK
jgi:hypothetical protein